MFTKFGMGRINSDGDQRGRLHRVGNVLQFLTYIALYRSW